MNEQQNEWAWLDDALETFDLNLENFDLNLKGFDLNLDELELDLDLTLPECFEIDLDCLPALDLVLPEHLFDIWKTIK